MTDLNYFNSPGINFGTSLPNDPPKPGSSPTWLQQVINVAGQVAGIFKPQGNVNNPQPQPTQTGLTSNTYVILAVLAGVILLVWVMNK